MRLAFCSCSKIQSVERQVAWTYIQQGQPDALLLLGDNVYLEHDHHVDRQKLLAELEEHYARQKQERNFIELLQDLAARRKPLFAIYDDHDFLGNNRCGGDHDPALREAARQALIEAFFPPMTGEDVYSATTLGNVRLIVLDTRFYRTAPSVSRNNRDAVLGVNQWRWLEKELENPGAPFVVIASSTTFHTFGDESWEHYPAAFERLRQLLGNKKGRLLISGDVHNNHSYDDSGVIEIVSSGVARKGLVFGGLRENFGLLDFDDQGVAVQLHGRKQRDRASFRIELDRWTL
jgi:alkaline phosphatase D